MSDSRELNFTPDDPLTLPEAAAMGRVDVIKYQAANLAFDVNQKDENGYTALMLSKTPQTAELLLSLGADPRIKHGEETVLDVQLRLSAEYALAAQNCTDNKLRQRNEIAATAHRAVHHRIESYITYVCCNRAQAHLEP